MDLIYTDANKVDQGVLQYYTLDVDTADTKDFEMTVDIDNNVMDQDSLWYIDGTELFGVVECVKSDTNAGTVTYSGRNARGFLNSKVIMPTGSDGYRYVSGLFRDIAAELFAEAGLTDYFHPDESSDLEIPVYKFDRYCTLYDGLVKMLAEYDSKIILTCKAGIVYVGASIKNDFSDYLQYGTDNTLMFEIEKNNQGVNHLVCLGSGEMTNRHVIHLFTDENGGIRPYATSGNPVQDSDYILDESQKMIFGMDENAEVYDYPNANTVTNYVLLPDVPADWYANYKSYFEPGDEGGEYKSVEGVTNTTYTVLTDCPSDWSNTFGSYFTHDATSGTYSSVKGIDKISYTKLKKKPSNWAKKYADYYEYWSDGVTKKYVNVQGVSYDKYHAQTMKPSDWHDNFDKYYKKKTVNDKTKYVTVDTDLPYKVKTKEKNVKIYEDAKASSKLVKTVKNKGTSYTVSKEKDNYGYITSVKGWIPLSKVEKSKPAAPAWKKGKYYTKETLYKAPAFDSKAYYKQVVLKDQAPHFAANKYYARKDDVYAPGFLVGKYYRCVYDHFAELVAGGIQRLQENCNSNAAAMSITELDCRIGDIVGGKDSISGIELYEEITNIIVKVTDGDMDLEYKIGDGKNGL